MHRFLLKLLLLINVYIYICELEALLPPPAMVMVLGINHLESCEGILAHGDGFKYVLKTYIKGQVETPQGNLTCTQKKT